MRLIPPHEFLDSDRLPVARIHRVDISNKLSSPGVASVRLEKKIWRDIDINMDA